MNNLASIHNALDYLQIPNRIVEAPLNIGKYDRVILPGVGAFCEAMNKITSSGFKEELQESAFVRQRPLLGIYLGMQLLLNSSVEYGNFTGMGFICRLVKHLHDVIKVLPNTVKQTKHGFSVSFSSATCLECTSFDNCSVKKSKKACYYQHKRKDIRLARRKRHEAINSFKDKYRYRAGVEATMSEYVRRTGVKHLRVRGMKAIVLNIFQASRYKKRTNPHSHHNVCVKVAPFSLLRHVKEQISQQMQFLIAAIVKLSLMNVC